MLYKIVIDDRSYSKWQIYDAPTLTPVTLDLDPCAMRLFSGDVFTYDAVNDAKFAGYIETKAKLNQIMIGFYDVGTLHCGSAHCGSVQRYYRGPDRLPQSAVPCPEHVVEEDEDTKQGCTLQGGSKKSKSKYSRKMKSKYSRKSKSKYLRKSKSKTDCIRVEYTFGASITSTIMSPNWM